MGAKIRIVIFAFLVRPLLLILFGKDLENADRLPKKGPAILVANHNSHLDTMILMTLFPSTMLPKIRAVAGADYFMRNTFMAWFFTNVVGIIAFDRSGKSRNCMDPIVDALKDDSIVIIYPEGTRGEPEVLSAMKNGVWHLAKRVPEVPIYPIYLSGMGKSWPKGKTIPVPFSCRSVVGSEMYFDQNRNEFMEGVGDAFEKLIGSRTSDAANSLPRA